MFVIGNWQRNYYFKTPVVYNSFIETTIYLRVVIAISSLGTITDSISQFTQPESNKVANNVIWLAAQKSVRLDRTREFTLPTLHDIIEHKIYIYLK